jgi:hypothetical protein
MASRANGTTDTYPEQFASEEAAHAALPRITIERWIADGDLLFVDRQY